MTLGSSVVTSQAVISLRSYLNPQGPTQKTICNYASDNSLTAGGSDDRTVIVPASTTDFEADLAALFPAMTGPIFVAVQDVTNPSVTNVGLGWGTAAGQVTQTLGPQGFFAWIADGSTALDSLFFDNANIADIILQVGVMSN